MRSFDIQYLLEARLVMNEITLCLDDQAPCAQGRMNARARRSAARLARLGLLAGLALAIACGAPSSAPGGQKAQPAPAKATPATPAAKPIVTPAAQAATPKPAATPAGVAKPTGATQGAQAALPVQAPDAFKVRFELSNGVVVAEFYKDWASIGAQRFYDLARANFFDGARFFRVVPNFVVQFGIAGDPRVDAQWAGKNIQDDQSSGLHPNVKGTITFAKSGAPNSRSTQLFINLNDNGPLDQMGFTPIGRIVEGMDVVEKIYSQYGDGPDQGGNGPEQGLAHAQGNAYLTQNFPKLDYIKKATVVR
jgi:peptidyl-prolyl cis-trans isomerase A (cyclophilin A)